MSDTIMDHGYKTTLTFGTSTVDELEILGLTPPAIEGGDEIDTTSFSNDEVRTAALRALYSFEAFEIRIKYSPSLYSREGLPSGLPGVLTVNYIRQNWRQQNGYEIH